MRARLPLVVSVLAASALAGCGAPDGDSRGTAFVFFDASARNAGLALVAGTEVLPAEAVPLEIDAPLEASLRRLPGGRPLRRGDAVPPAARLEQLATVGLQPDEAVHVRGSEGEMMRGPADADRLYLVGPEKAVQELAARFGAWPTRLDGSEDAAALGRADRWVLIAPDVLSLVATLETRELEDLEAVVPAFAGGDAADEQDRELGRAADEEDTARNEARAIERDLAVLVTLEGETGRGSLPTFDSGERIPVRARLVNESARARAVVLPGDGSSVGWREPYVRWTVERETAPGVWQKLADAPYSRCGHYDPDWHTDVMLLAPGESQLLDNMISVEGRADIHAPGKYRARAHYEYRAGFGTRRFSDLVGVGVSDEGSPSARLIEAVPAFEIVSAPFEFRVETGLVLEVRPRAAAIDAAAPDSVEVWLMNGSRVPRALGPGKVNGLAVQVVDETGKVLYHPFYLEGPDVDARVLAPGTGVRLPLVLDASYSRYPPPDDLPRATWVRATGWMSEGPEDPSPQTLSSPRVAMAVRGAH
ncbi:MAG: hypothetical protein WKG00_28250 [Polyangiaceae bacterium]